MSGIIFRTMTTLVTGAFGCIGAWVIRGLLAAGARPEALDLGDLGPAPPTSLADGVDKTLDEFARLQQDGRLDCRELT
jgi:nucleoside-diphosphate-sugar epimerase